MDPLKRRAELQWLLYTARNNYRGGTGHKAQTLQAEVARTDSSPETSLGDRAPGGAGQGERQPRNMPHALADGFLISLVVVQIQNEPTLLLILTGVAIAISAILRIVDSK